MHKSSGWIRARHVSHFRADPCLQGVVVAVVPRRGVIVEARRGEHDKKETLELVDLVNKASKES